MSNAFREIPGCPGYRVNRLGEVMGQRGRILAQTTTKKGYKKLTFWKNGKRLKDVRVHRVVLLAFVGPCPSHLDCCRHLDGNPANNNLENLAWGTFEQNERDKLMHGSMGRKLEPRQVTEIRKARAKGASLRGLSERYGVHISTVSEICNFRTWRHPFKVLAQESNRPDKELGEERFDVRPSREGGGRSSVDRHPERAEV